MKNRKYRKLQFIRRKNRLRLGEPIYWTQKVSAPLLASEIEDILFEACRHLRSRFKLALYPVDLEAAYVGDDFINDLLSIKIKIKHAC